MKWLFLYILVVLGLLCGCREESSGSAVDSAEEIDEVDGRVADMIASEELIQALAPQLKLLGSEITTGTKIDEVRRDTSQGGIGLTAASIDSIVSEKAEHFPHYISAGKWPLTAVEKNTHLPPWQSLSSSDLKWEYAKFGVTGGQFEGKDTFYLHTTCKLTPASATICLVNLKRKRPWAS